MNVSCLKQGSKMNTFCLKRGLKDHSGTPLPKLPLTFSFVSLSRNDEHFMLISHRMLEFRRLHDSCRISM